MHNFRELHVWKDAKDLSVSIYKLTSLFPKSEVYGMVSQINRSSVSIPSNVAEGAGRNTKKDFSRFVSIAIGSAFELETQIIIAFELNYIEEEKYKDTVDGLIKVQKQLVQLKKHLDK